MSVAHDTPLEVAVKPRTTKLLDTGALIERKGIELAAIGACAAAVAQLVDFAAYGNQIRWLDMNTHASLFGVVSVLALVAALGMAILLAVSTATRSRPSISLPALLATLLALRILHPAHVILLALPFASATFVIVWWRIGTAGSHARNVLRLGSAILVGSYVIHAFGTSIVTALGHGPDTWPSQVELVIRHSGELAGWTIVATGLLGALIDETPLAERPASDVA